MKIYTVKAAAEKCGLSPGWINHLITRGDLQATKHGNTWLITESQINQYLKNRKKKKTDKKKACREWLQSQEFQYLREKGKKRGYWKDNIYYGLTATEAYAKAIKEIS